MCYNLREELLSRKEMVFMWNKLFSSVDILQKGLDAAWTRNAVIRNNIANVETPGFKSSDVQFEDAFARALYGDSRHVELKNTREKHFAGVRQSVSEVSHRIVDTDDVSMRMDENNVDIENENAKLAQNSIQYNALLAKLNSEIRRLNMAITEGR